MRRRRCRRRTKLPRFSTPLSLSVPLTFPFILQISTHKCTRTTHNTAKLFSPYISLSFSPSLSISLCLSFILSLPLKCTHIHTHDTPRCQGHHATMLSGYCERSEHVAATYLKRRLAGCARREGARSGGRGREAAIGGGNAQDGGRGVPDAPRRGAGRVAGAAGGAAGGGRFELCQKRGPRALLLPRLFVFSTINGADLSDSAEVWRRGSSVRAMTVSCGRVAKTRGWRV